MKRRVYVAEDAKVALVAAAQAEQQVERGGVLIGLAVGRAPWITQAIEIPGDAGPAHYVLPAGKTRAAVLAARNDDSRLGYLGEWHSHIGSDGPSSIDHATMRAVSWYLERRGRVRGPVLVLVRRTATGYQLDAHVMSLLVLRQAELVLTGPPPPA